MAGASTGNPNQNDGTRSLGALVMSPVGTPPPVPLTFGIELEYLFVKPLSIDVASSNHRLYTSRPTDDSRIPENMMRSLSPPNDGQVLALHQAGMLIKERTGKDLLRFSRPPYGIKYDKWHITSEECADLRGNQFVKLPQWTGGRVSASDVDSGQWMAMGQELVSRILNVPDISTRRADLGPDMMEVRQFVQALTFRSTDGCFFISEVDNAGVHVHIGLPPIQTSGDDGDGATTSLQSFDLKFLQHLAYILIEYEHIISLFHDPQRRGFNYTKTTFVAESNRYGTLGQRHTCGIYPLPVLRIIQERLFTRDMTLLGLMRLMGWQHTGQNFNGSRSKFVNWTNLMNQGGKRTLEFRQHQGTLNADDIEQWIIFVISLVRAAERKAYQDVTPNVSPTSPTADLPPALQWGMRQGRKYCTRYEGEERMMEKLFDLLQLKNSRQTYWRNRVSQFKGDQYTNHNWYQSCAQCLTETQNSDLIDIIDAAVHNVLDAESDVIQNNHRIAELQAQLATGTTNPTATTNWIAAIQKDLVVGSRLLKEARDRAASLLTLEQDTVRVRARTAAYSYNPQDPFLPDSAIDVSGAPPDQRLRQIIQDRLNDPDGVCDGDTLTQTMTQADRDRLSASIAGLARGEVERRTSRGRQTKRKRKRPGRRGSEGGGHHHHGAHHIDLTKSGRRGRQLGTKRRRGQ